MEKHEFKIGDKVRIVGNGDKVHTTRHHFDNGEVVEIESITTDGSLFLRRWSDGLLQIVDQEHVEAIEEDQEHVEIVREDQK